MVAVTADRTRPCRTRSATPRAGHVGGHGRRRREPCAHHPRLARVPGRAPGRARPRRRRARRPPRPDETVECQLHEALLNLAFGDAEGFRLCVPYDVTTLDPAVLHEARCTHPLVVEGGTRPPSPAFRGTASALAVFETPLPPPPSTAQALSFGLESLGEVRAFVTAAALRADLDEGGLRNIVLAAHEVAANSLRHGGGLGVLRVWADRTSLVAEIRNRGVSATPWPGAMPRSRTSSAAGACGSPTRPATSCSCATSPTARSSGSPCADASDRRPNAGATGPQRLPWKVKLDPSTEDGTSPPTQGVPVPAPRIITAQWIGLAFDDVFGPARPRRARDGPLQRGATRRRLASGGRHRPAVPRRPLRPRLGRVRLPLPHRRRRHAALPAAGATAGRARRRPQRREPRRLLRRHLRATGRRAPSARPTPGCSPTPTPTRCPPTTGRATTCARRSCTSTTSGTGTGRTRAPAGSRRCSSPGSTSRPAARRIRTPRGPSASRAPATRRAARYRGIVADGRHVSVLEAHQRRRSDRSRDRADADRDDAPREERFGTGPARARQS